MTPRGSAGGGGGGGGGGKNGDRTRSLRWANTDSAASMHCARFVCFFRLHGRIPSTHFGLQRITDATTNR